MVLDVKMMGWASQNGIDTGKLKAARVPIYGKWYFPNIPAGVALISLESGERQVFAEPVVAGEVMWVPERDLRRARLGPYAHLTEEEVAAQEAAESRATAPRAVVELPEPLLLMNRAPSAEIYATHASSTFAEIEPVSLSLVEEGDPALIHLPQWSLAPLLLALGIAIVLVGIVTHVVVLVVGLVWVALGVMGWIKVGLAESRARTHPLATPAFPTRVQGSTREP